MFSPLDPPGQSHTQVNEISGALNWKETQRPISQLFLSLENSKWDEHKSFAEKSNAMQPEILFDKSSLANSKNGNLTPSFPSC